METSFSALSFCSGNKNRLRCVFPWKTRLLVTRAKRNLLHFRRRNIFFHNFVLFSPKKRSFKFRKLTPSAKPLPVSVSTLFYYSCFVRSSQGNFKKFRCGVLRVISRNHSPIFHFFSKSLGLFLQITFLQNLIFGNKLFSFVVLIKK